MTLRASHLLASFLTAYFTAGQSTDTVRVDVDTFDELRVQQELVGIDTLTYIDSTFSYQVKVPAWFNLMETGSVNIWGGTLPATDGIKNAIAIKSFDKTGFTSMEAFRRYVAEDLVFGKPAPWSDTHISMGKKELGQYGDLGPAYKAYFMSGKLLYYCEYVLVETPTAWIWIDFTSTQETFDRNLGKFEEFLAGFRVNEFK